MAEAAFGDYAETPREFILDALVSKAGWGVEEAVAIMAQFLSSAVEAVEASRGQDRSVVFAGGARNTGSRSRPDGDEFTDAQWHQYAIGDSGTSHTLPGRLYVVQCEWCPLTFAAPTKVEAMALFRAHEEEVLNA
ncbi:hypothetical protein [Pseudoclavibacter helvolus]|uniref:Uncharacterized protein n=1 Tax=Pseudoclavibacter helvolus TaxID=255205 RepID=A0A7W4YES3_9MICO|nr:hypothetical protein [Pseudoclavibacter helvolus]MBB2956808.1 hypothetical protein [Pseudoclavibacter helvolus]